MIPKGSGSENNSFLKMAIPADGVDAIKTFVIDCVLNAGGKRARRRSSALASAVRRTCACTGQARRRATARIGMQRSGRSEA